MSDDILTLPPPRADKRLTYGTDANQFLDLRLPSSKAKSKAPHPLVINIHGGFWRAQYNLDHAGHLCAALTAKGLATANLEYRRVGNPGGAWPGTFADIRAAYQFLLQNAVHYNLDRRRIVVMGHSAGGQLALCLAAHETSIRRVVTLAGVVDLQRAEEHDLMRRYGEEGARLWHLARGIDTRAVDPERDTKSISAETTFERDIGEFRPLEQHLWDLTERVSARLKANALAGSTVTLKLKSADFKTRTRARALGHPTQLAARIFAAGRDLLAHEVGTTRFRLIGIGVSHMAEATGDDLADLIDRRAAEAEHAVDRLRAKFGRAAVVKGLALDED